MLISEIIVIYPETEGIVLGLLKIEETNFLSVGKYRLHGDSFVFRQAKGIDRGDDEIFVLIMSTSSSSYKLHQLKFRKN